MAESIKGISVVISGETTALTASLAEVNTASRNIQGELNQVQRLLRMDPGNTTLISQQQTLLGNAVATSREKLESLRAAQQQVQEQFARGEISEGQYRAFEREVASAEQQVQRFEQRLRDTQETSRTTAQRVQELGEQAGKVGEKMKDVGEKMSMAVTAPIVAASGLIAKGAIDAEAATGKLQAQLGITAAEADKLGVSAQNVWKTGFGEDINAASEAVKNVRLNMGDLAGNELEAVAQGALVISDVFEADITDSTKAAGTMMKNFGIDGQAALDLITVGFQKGGDYSGELLDTLNEYSPQFAGMGMSADQMMGILIAGAQAGAFNMDKVGDSVKEFNIRAQDGSKTTAEGFAAIGLSADEMGAAIAKGGDDAQQAFMATIAALAAMDDPMQQNIAGTALFGTQWEDVRSKVITAMADGVKGIGDFKGATDEAAAAMKENNPGLALTAAMRELQSAIGPALLPIADIIQNTVVPAIKSLAEWFENLSPAGQKTVLAIGGIAAAIGPLLIVIGTLMTAVSTVAGLFGAGGALATAFAFITGPIGIAVAAIAGIIAIGVLLYKNWDEISAKAIEIWDGIKDYFSETWSKITSACSDAWGRFKSDIVETWNNIKTKTSEIWNGIKQFFADWWNFEKNIFNTALDFVKNIISTAWDNIKSITSTVWNGIKDFMSTTWDNIKNAVATKAAELKTNTINKLEEIWDYIKAVPAKALQWGKDIIQGLWDGIKNMGATFASNLKTWIEEHIPGVFRDLLDMHSPSQLMATLGVNTILGYIEGIVSKGPDVDQTMADMVEKVKTSINPIIDSMKTIGEEAANGFVNAISAATQRADEIMSSWHDQIQENIRNGDYGVPLDDWEDSGGGGGGGGSSGGAVGGIIGGTIGTVIGGAIGGIGGLIGGLFADGGVVDHPTLALIGEDPRTTPEIVAPQRMLFDTVKSALQSVVGGGNVTVQNIIQIDGKVVAKEAVNHLPGILRQPARAWGV